MIERIKPRTPTQVGHVKLIFETPRPVRQDDGDFETPTDDRGRIILDVRFSAAVLDEHGVPMQTVQGDFDQLLSEAEGQDIDVRRRLGQIRTSMNWILEAIETKLIAGGEVTE